MRNFLRSYSHIIFIVFLSFGRFFCLDIISDLQLQLKSCFNSSNAEDILELNEWFDIPNIMVDVICGFIIDNFLSLPNASLIFSLIALFGHILLILAVHFQIFWIAITSRILFGIGCESLIIVQLTLGTRTSFLKTIHSTFGIIFSTSLLAFLIGIFLTYLITDMTVLQHIGIFSIGPLISVLSAMFLVFNSQNIKLLEEIKSSENSDSTKSKTSFLKFSFIILAVLFISVGSFPFVQYFKDLLKYKYEKSPKYILMSTNIFNIFRIFTFIFAALPIDRIGHKYIWLITSLFFIIVTNFLILFTTLNITFLMVLKGIGSSIAELILWASICFSVPANEYGTGFGFVQAFRNIGTVASVKLGPRIHRKTGIFIEWVIQTIVLYITFTFSMLSWFMDKY